MSAPSPTSAHSENPKKGLHPLAWVGIGCGGLIFLVIAGIIFVGMIASNKLKETGGDPERFVAEMIVKLNPDLELIETDEDSGEIKIRMKKSGEEISVSYKDIQEGNLVIETERGSMKIDANAGAGKFEITDNEGKTKVINTDGKTMKMQGPDGTTEMTMGGNDPWASLPEWAKGFAYPKTAESITTMSSNIGGKNQCRIMVTTGDAGAVVKKFYTEKLKADSYTLEQHEMSFDEMSTSTVKGSKGERTVEVTITSTPKKHTSLTFLSTSPE